MIILELWKNNFGFMALIAASGILWAAHDCYFWDQYARRWVQKYFKDWHYLKIVVFGLFAAGIIIMPRTCSNIILLALIRWHSFSIGMWIFSRANVPCNAWAGRARRIFDFLTSLEVSIILLVMWFMLGGVKWF